MENRKEVSEIFSTKSKCESNSSGPERKMSKQEKIEAEMEDEMENKDGVERMLTKSYYARELISIDLLSISKKVCTTMIEYKVIGLAKSIKNRCDPSNLVLTVIPKDDESFDKDNLNSNSYEIINGRHRYEALKYLDRKGELSSLKGLEERSVLCYILNTSCPILANYGQLRGNELQAMFTRKPFVHEIMFVAEGLNDLYPANQVMEVIIRYCKVVISP